MDRFADRLPFALFTARAPVFSLAFANKSLRLYIELINYPMPFKDVATPAE